jgi:hypothetical protein
LISCQRRRQSFYSSKTKRKRNKRGILCTVVAS